MKKAYTSEPANGFGLNKYAPLIVNTADRTSESKAVVEEILHSWQIEGLNK